LFARISLIETSLARQTGEEVGEMTESERNERCAFGAWGILAAIDLYGCDPGLVRSEEFLREVGIKLTEVVGMKRYGDPQVYRFGIGDLEGLTLVQLIETSTITIHCDETDNRVFIDLFSCKHFESKDACDFLVGTYKARDYYLREFLRGRQMNVMTCKGV
jgi:S-adenosylmethionine/arginine decarboxylase-like enzyme